MCNFSSNFRPPPKPDNLNVNCTFQITQRLQVQHSRIAAVALSQVIMRYESHSTSPQWLNSLFDTRWLYQAISTLFYSILPTRNHGSHHINSYYSHLKLKNSSTTTHHLLTIKVQIVTTRPRYYGGHGPRYGSSRGRDAAGWTR